MRGGNSRDRGAGATISADRRDRILVGVCAAVWLVLVGMSVAAAVALVDLGRGFHRSGNPHTPAVLYAIIIVSALVIVAAIPMLLYARRRAAAEATVRPVRVSALGAGPRPMRPGHPPPARTMAGEARTGRLSGVGSATAPSDAEVGRIWLRGTVGLVGAMGAALVAVATATYLMAIGRDGAAWTGYGIAGVVTVAMPVIPWLYLRRLYRVREAPSD